MRISEITATDIARYANIDVNEAGDMSLVSNIIMPAAKRYIADFLNKTIADVDNYEDITIAYMALCSHLFDNRSFASENPNTNDVIISFLNAHAGGLCG